MNGRKNKKQTIGIRVLAVGLLLAQLFGAEMAAAADLSHGTAEHEITEDMLVTKPAEGYTVNPATQGEAKDGRYNDYFLDSEIQTVRIEIEEDNLNYLLQNAAAEPYVMTNRVTIGDVSVDYCGLKTKGSYTLEHSVTDNAGSDRFSFTINFGKYVKKKEYGETQNFFGVSKISFNNLFFDKSMMKEFFALKLMEEMGLPTPQYGLAKLYINGSYYGVYAMIEAMDTPILEQYYGVAKDALSSYLCKPEGTNFLYEELKENNAPLWENDEDTLKDVEDMLPTVEEWVRRLNCLSEQKNFENKQLDVNNEGYLTLLEQILDVDEVVKYFAVHSWLCQMDNMFVGQKNFGLYVDRDGKALLIPWDYDLSFGCYYPSTAENTANYDIDVMYRLDYWATNRDAVTAQTYQQFPLFNVIYQNDALMEQYHGYMKECSKIAALGGTVASSGKTYEPGYFNSYIEKMQDAVILAATEGLAENVYYMNGIRQPQDVKRALPNLSKIIAMRSAGVYAQVEHINATVCGLGCDLSTLGNAISADNATHGNLIAIDAATGIFVNGFYTGNQGSGSPGLTVKKLTKTDEMYEQIRAAVACDKKDGLWVYRIENAKKAQTRYTVYVPLTKTQMTGKEVQFYSYSADGRLTALEMKADDNLYYGKTETVDYIVLVKPDGAALLEQETEEKDIPATSKPAGNEAKRSSVKAALVVGAILVGALILTLVIAQIRRVFRKRKAGRGKRR